MRTARLLTVSHSIRIGGLPNPCGGRPPWMQTPPGCRPLRQTPLDANPLLPGCRPPPGCRPSLEAWKQTPHPGRTPVDRRNDTRLWKHYRPATTVDRVGNNEWAWMVDVLWHWLLIYVRHQMIATGTFTIDVYEKLFSRCRTSNNHNAQLLNWMRGSIWRLNKAGVSK